MKNYLFILALIITLSACKKDNAIKSTPGEVVGTWELKTYMTGWIQPQSYNPGNGDRYIFRSDKTYTKYLNNKVEKQGTYTLSFTSEQEGTKFGKIVLTNPDYADVFSIKENTFIIGTSAADGPSWEYTRIK
ncbi:hypothetical protein INP83_20900 [Mucilaginibacter sp. 21P]|uniref:hypothetical protein n=1 Tax=Mucilaginibacter sp. 21P TaxID=2778902 RepID=UPI001C59D6AD|nr:hypothetical protein [Mucilaginibacter sp. 21P]QXV65488.1 hypothetical protein INP83_20900 [Mucilaginibacter sp. 21P]